MIFTEPFLKLEKDYTSSGTEYIQYNNFQYAGCIIRVIYTHPDDHTYSLSLYITYENHVILAPFYISSTNGIAQLTPYFDPAIYDVLKPIIANDNYSTVPLFESVTRHILNESKNAMTENEYTSMRKSRTAVEKNRQNGELYFNHLRKANISKDMINRLYRMYPQKTAKTLISTLRRSQQTPVFVSERERRHDLIILVADRATENERILLLQ